jgi:uncharacterized membrane protein YsdA (DUF1294 family)
MQTSHRDENDPGRARSGNTETDREMSRKPENFFKTVIFFKTKVLPLQKYRARTADDRNDKIPEETLCSIVLTGGGCYCWQVSTE